MIGGGYHVSPEGTGDVTATVDGPSGDGRWEVDILNNSGKTVQFAAYAICM